MKVKIIISCTVLIALFMCSFIERTEKVDSETTVNVNKFEAINSTTYNKISNTSYLDWTAAHIGGVNKRHGKIYFKEASLSVDNNKITSSNFVVDMSTLIVIGMNEADAEDLGSHLKSSDFFDIEKYPTSQFELTSIEPSEGVYNSKVTGDLTILDKTKSISFNANINISINEVSLVSEIFSIDRSDWGLTYNRKGTLGVPLDYLIADEISFLINVTVGK